MYLSDTMESISSTMISSSLDVGGFNQQTTMPTSTSNSVNSYTSLTPPEYTQIYAMDTYDTNDLINISNLTADDACGEVTSSSIFNDRYSIDVMDTFNPENSFSTVPESSGIMSPDEFDSSTSCITLVNAKPYTEFSDVSSQSDSSFATCSSNLYHSPMLSPSTPPELNTDFKGDFLMSSDCLLQSSSSSSSSSPELNLDFEDFLGYSNRESPVARLSLESPPVSNLLAIQGQDDVSSPNSYDSSATSKRYKKGPTPRQQEDLCLVCGDRASGYHYNALTCEGCKGFFRRSITKKAVYTCKYGMQCEIDMYMRRKCQECRFKKCITIGMREECVIPEGACQKKREQKKAREREKLKSASPDDEITKVIKMGVKGECLLNNSLLYENSYIPENQSFKFDTVRLPWNPFTEDQVQLNSAQADLINRLLFTQELFEVPTNENHKSMKTTDSPNDECSAQFTHITSMTVVTVQLIVEFAKRVPGFDTLLQNDQIVLLKACTSEVIMLRAARRYDAKTDSIVFGNNFPYKREAYNMAGMVPEITNTLFEFCARMARMKVDNAEYALLTAISIFSERPMLSDPKKVDRLQELFVLALQMYTNKKYDGNAPSELGKLMSILTELRTLAHLNNKQCYTIKKNNKLPDFLLELWDLNAECS